MAKIAVAIRFVQHKCTGTVTSSRTRGANATRRSKADIHAKTELIGFLFVTTPKRKILYPMNVPILNTVSIHSHLKNHNSIVWLLRKEASTLTSYISKKKNEIEYVFKVGTIYHSTSYWEFVSMSSVYNKNDAACRFQQE